MRMACVGPAVPCDRGQSAHLCSHLLRRGRTDIKSLLQALPAHSDCAHGCQGECAAIGSRGLRFSSAWPPERTIKINKTAVVGTRENAQVLWKQNGRREV